MENKWMWLAGFLVIMAAGAVYWSYSNQPAKPVSDSNLNLATPPESQPLSASEAPPIVDTPAPQAPEPEMRRLPPMSAENPSNPPPSNNPTYPQPFEGNPGMGVQQMDPGMDPMAPPTNPPFFDDEYHPPDEYAGPPMQEGMQQGIPPQPNPFGADEYDE